jgi:hypothetical protein
MKGLDNKIEEIIMCLKFRPIKETHDSLRGLVLSEKSQAVQEALEKQEEELGAGIDMLFSVVNEDCSYFVDGENADKFQELLKLLIKGKMWKVCEDDNTLNEFTSEVIDLINDSREEK